MENKGIIFEKDIKKPEYFVIIVCIFAFLILVFQIVANRHISKAGRNVIEGVKAKKIAAFERRQKALDAKERAKQRLIKEQREKDFQAAAEAQFNDIQTGNKAKPGMDFTEKLGIYNQAVADAKADSKAKQRRKQSSKF